MKYTRMARRPWSAWSNENHSKRIHCMAGASLLIETHRVLEMMDNAEITASETALNVKFHAQSEHRTSRGALVSLVPSRGRRISATAGLNA